MAQSKPFYYDNGLVAASPFTIDWNNGEVQKVTIDPAFPAPPFQIDFANPLTVGSIYVLEVISNGIPVNFPANVEWGAAGAPTLSGGGAADLFNFYWTGSKYFGSYALNYIP